MRRTSLVAIGAMVAASVVMGAHPAGASPAHKKKAKPGIGQTIVVENEAKQDEAVKLIAVTTPATAQTPTFTTPPAGDRFVGVTLQIKNKSKGTDSNSADDNTSIVGSNKQVYTATIATLSGCTDFDDGTYTLAKGASEIGCVAFAIPNGVKVAKVEYNPDAGFSTNNATWYLKS